MHVAASIANTVIVCGRSCGAPIVRLACKSAHRCRHNPFAVLATIKRNAHLSRESIMHGPPRCFPDVQTDAYEPHHHTNPRRCQPRNQFRQAAASPLLPMEPPIQSHAGQLKHATCGRRWFGRCLLLRGIRAKYEVLAWVWLCTNGKISRSHNPPAQAQSPST